MAWASPSLADGFAAGISPARFELEADPGDVVREIVTIVNPTDAETDYLFRTAEWSLDEAGNVHFDEEALAADSCRPWVRLERRTVRLRGGHRKNYRFEVHVPDEVEPGLCRFAILVEPGEAYEAVSDDGSINMPVVGRYAIITYVTIGDAAPEIEFLGITTRDRGSDRVPALVLRNNGATLGRAFGQVMATDAGGNRISLVPSSFPLLPGRTESIELSPEDPSAPAADSAWPLEFPVELDGRVEVGGEVIRIDQVFRIDDAVE